MFFIHALPPVPAPDDAEAVTLYRQLSENLPLRAATFTIGQRQ
jgi:hypothetical protein